MTTSQPTNSAPVCVKCVNCGQEIYQSLDPNNIYWYHRKTGSAVCAGLNAMPAPAVQEKCPTCDGTGKEGIGCAIGHPAMVRTCPDCFGAGIAKHEFEGYQDSLRRNFCQRCDRIKSAVVHFPAPAAAAPVEGELREFDHFSIVPFKAICGTDVPNQSTTQTPEKAKCATCWFYWDEWNKSRTTTAPVSEWQDKLNVLRQQVEDTIAVAQTDEDEQGFITAYHFKTGAIHRLLAEARRH